MDSLNEAEARARLAEPHHCEDVDPDDWKVLDRPKGAFNFELGLLNAAGRNAGLFVELVFYRSPETALITVKMSVFQHVKRQPRVLVYQLQITTKSYNPENWHDVAHEHFGDSRRPVSVWTTWRSFQDVLDYFCRTTNIEFRPPLEDPERLRLTP